jgi:Predicted endonuclease distantly related to archaeal Holliday junction resolvase and Mrr-like restriction enzymes
VTYDDLHLYDNVSWSCPLDDGKVIRCLGTRPDDKYKEGGQWFCILHYWKDYAYAPGVLGFWLLVIGGLAATSKNGLLGGVVILGFGLLCLLCAILPGVVINDLRKRASPSLKAYWQALQLYDQHKAAAEEVARKAAEAACKAARDVELRKRSYWAFLNGYEFERATAEVMQKHHFTAMVTPGSGDGGVDIQVTRNGLKGVVQCKAHVACVGPHVVRDLYGVIHHSRASFGIIISRGGFTKGAVEFARDKPIHFLDISDLIAMQEGRDVLAAAFSDSRSATASCDIVES